MRPLRRAAPRRASSAVTAASYGYSLRKTAAGWQVIEQVLFLIS